jgi:hypothetical protein
MRTTEQDIILVMQVENILRYPVKIHNKLCPIESRAAIPEPSMF